MPDMFHDTLNDIIDQIEAKRQQRRSDREVQQIATRTAMKQEIATRILCALLAPPRQHSMPEMVELSLAGAEHLISQLEQEAKNVAARKV